MKRTNVYLEESQTVALDQLARLEGVSRAEILRRLVDREIAGSSRSDLDADLAAIDASFGVGLDGMEPLQRGNDQRSRYLDEIVRS